MGLVGDPPPFPDPSLRCLDARSNDNGGMPVGSVVVYRVAQWSRFTDRAIGQWRCRLECVVQQQGGHIEHLM